jgi:hypothetical protein
MVVTESLKMLSTAHKANSANFSWYRVDLVFTRRPTDAATPRTTSLEDRKVDDAPSLRERVRQSLLGHYRAAAL